MVLKVNPEFGVELALAVPYAYYKHLHGELDGVETSIGMAPFYFFTPNVKEVYTSRTVNNIAAGITELPNDWIHHNALALTGRDYSELSPEQQREVNGVLDYSEWICPPYREHFSNLEPVSKFNIGNGNNIVFITNKYNVEHGERPLGYFSVECILNMILRLIDKNYTVVYKRCDNTSPILAYDENERESKSWQFPEMNVNGQMMDDFGLIRSCAEAGYDVHLMDDILPALHENYNTAQLMLMSRCSKFISVCGGNSILSALFGGTLVTYVHKGKELRDNYFQKNSYMRRLSGADVIPVLDPIQPNGVLSKHNYEKIYTVIDEKF